MEYNSSINNKRKGNMRLADEIDKINQQSKEIKEIRKDISDIMKGLEP